MGKFNSGKCIAIAALVGLLISHSVQAQDSTEPEIVEEVLVTASKREQSVQDTPFSVQALNGASMESAAIRDLGELITLVPGASEGAGVTVGQRTFYIRGTGGAAGSATTSYYVDDSPYHGITAPVGATFDIQRVEVLRGPQGTLYGNGSLGGTVRYVTNKPNLEEFQAVVHGAYSEPSDGDSGWSGDVALNIPFNDSVGVRLVASRQDIGGYLNDLFGNQDQADATTEHFRGILRWDATKNLNFRVSYSESTADQDGTTLLTLLEPPTTISLPGDFNDLEYSILDATLEYEFSGARLISAFSQFDNQTDTLLNLPFPGFGLPNDTLEIVQTGETDTFSNETRLVSTGEGPMRWLVGIYVTDTERLAESTTNFPAFIPDTVETTKVKTRAIFGEISRELLDGKLIPLIGVRHFEEEQERSSLSGKNKFDSVNPRFNLSWLPTESSHYYFNIAKGFRSGVVNSPTFCDLHAQFGGLPCQLEVESDELWSYEVGTKQVLAGGQVSLEAAFYYQDWQDVQQSVPFFGLTQIYQFSDAQIPGIDVVLSWKPKSVEGLTLTASANWNDATLEEVDPALGAIVGAQDGDRRPLTPEKTFSFVGNYNWGAFGDWHGHVTIGFSHISGQFGQLGTVEKGSARDLMRARFGFSNAHIGLYLFGSNLLKEDGAIYSQTPAGGVSVFTQDYPRQVGIEFIYNHN